MKQVSPRRIVCEDGFSMSVVVSSYGLEIGYPSSLDPILEKMGCLGYDMHTTCPDSGYVNACWESGVTVRLVMSIIDSHGGRHLDQESGRMNKLLRHWGACSQVEW
jgi:hypothetical protein